MASMTAVTRRVIADGDLVLPSTITPDDRSPLTSVVRLSQAVGDGYGRRPLSTEWDYADTRRRICETIFPDECETLARGDNSGILKTGESQLHKQG